MPQPHILVVDDDPIVRETVKHVLLESGYQISEATNGLGALESIARTRPDLILLDVMMSACAQDRRPLSLFPGTHGIGLLDVRAAAACGIKRTWVSATPMPASCRIDSIPRT